MKIKESNFIKNVIVNFNSTLIALKAFERFIRNNNSA